MSTLSEIAKSLQQQQQGILQGLSGFRSIGIPEVYRFQNDFPKALGGIADALKTIARQYKPLEFHPSTLTVNSVIPAIAKHNELLATKLSGLASSQFILSNSLAEMAKVLSSSHLQKFNAFDMALQGISRSFLKDLARERDWDEIEIAEQANEAIATIADDLSNTSEPLTFEHLDNFRSSIISRLLELLSKAKTKKAIKFIITVISVVGSLVGVYSFYLQKTDKTHGDIIDESNKIFGDYKNEHDKQFDGFKKEVTEQLEIQLGKLHKTRIAISNVNLRYSPRKNSQIIGIVKSGQVVTVIEIHSKYLLISYLDQETGEPKSGFVMKKYFKLEE